MRRFLIVLLSFICLAAQAQVRQPSYFHPDYASLTSENHPRIILDDTSFQTLKDSLQSAPDDGILKALNTAIIKNADGLISTGRIPKHQYDASNLRILSESRFTLARVFACAYAYRLTGEDKYLQQAENDILTVCAFPDWNAHKHFLDTGEMAAAVGIGYDWLYPYLSESTKRTAEQTLYTHAFQPSTDEKKAAFYQMLNNWNQVCNAGLVVGALAVYERCDTTARRIIDDAYYSNLKPMEFNYSPDGNYAEGPAYWGYGTMFEVLMLSAMESCLGTDFALSETPGFLDSGRYMLHVTGIGRKDFNYYDNGENELPAMPMWYFAAMSHDPSMLHNEIALLKSGKYKGYDTCRLMPMAMAWAYKLDLRSIPSPKAHFYCGRGKTPIALVRGDWSGTSSDRFLGIKGGSPSTSHAHMDGGCFVYDAYGMRWSMDMTRQRYQTVENQLRAIGSSYWQFHQESLRWQLFRINNRQHSTLTINGKDHLVAGDAPLLEVFDTDERRGASFDLTSLFAEEAACVQREAAVIDGDYLAVKDSISALPGKDANVRFTLVTPAQPTITERGIILTQGGVSLLLAASIDVQYRIWSSDPKDYQTPCSHLDEPNPGVYICGFEIMVPAGESRSIRTTLTTL